MSAVGWCLKGREPRSGVSGCLVNRYCGPAAGPFQVTPVAPLQNFVIQGATAARRSRVVRGLDHTDAHKVLAPRWGDWPRIGIMHDPRVPETLEGWSLLHQMFRVRWDAWRALPEKERRERAAASVDALAGMPSGEDGATALTTLLGHKGDLMLIHFRREF